MTNPAGPENARVLRAVPARNALAWFAEAMRLVKRGPFTFAALGFIVLLSSFAGLALDGFPVVGFFVDKMLQPLLAAGMLYASLAADRNEAPRVRHVLAAFLAPARAQAAVVLASLAIFACEALAAWRIAGINLLTGPENASMLSMEAIMAIYLTGVAASLPLTFVPFAAMFDGQGIRASFVVSTRAFARNIGALALYGAISLALLLLGVMTMGIALVVVLPLIAAATYAAWKDIFSVATGSGSG